MIFSKNLKPQTSPYFHHLPQHFQPEHTKLLKNLYQLQFPSLVNNSPSQPIHRPHQDTSKPHTHLTPHPTTEPSQRPHLKTSHPPHTAPYPKQTHHVPTRLQALPLRPPRIAALGAVQGSPRPRPLPRPARAPGRPSRTVEPRAFHREGRSPTDDGAPRAQRGRVRRVQRQNSGAEQGAEGAKERAGRQEEGGEESCGQTECLEAQSLQGEEP